MKRPRLHTLPLIALLTLSGASPGWAQVDPLATVNGFAPSLTLTESMVDSIKTTSEPNPDGPPLILHEPVTTDRSSLTLVANISGIDLASIDPTTAFSVTVGGLTAAGTLGDDPAYTDLNKATKRSIFIPAKVNPETGKAIGTNGIKLSWTATRLTLTISRASDDDTDPGAVAASAFVNLLEPGSRSDIRETMSATVSFADLTSAPRPVFIKGSASMRVQKFGSEDAGTLEEFQLNNVSVTGEFDTSPPSVSILSPANNSSPGPNFTLTGKAGDGKGVDSVEFTDNPADPDSWQPLAEPLTDLPPDLPATFGDNAWGTTNKAWSLSLTGQPFGTNHIYVRSTDSSGNRSTPAMVALINPVPALLTGRWDGLARSKPGGKDGCLTFTCDSKGTLSGKLTLEGSAAPLSFTGAWSGQTIRATLKRSKEPSLLLSGTVNSTSPASASAALIYFDLELPPAVDGDPNLPFSSGTVFRCPFSSAQKLPRLPVISPALGRFNFKTAEGDGLSTPSGNGYFSLDVADTGLVNITGKTADGTSFTLGSNLGANGQVALFAPLYGNRGSFFGLEQIDMTLGTVIADDCTWRRPPSFTDKQFPDGFAVNLDVSGARHVTPAKNVRVMSLNANAPNSSAVMTGEGITALPPQLLEVTSGNTVVPIGGSSDFKAMITPGTGMVTGSFNLPGSKTAAKWSALIVGNRAAGFYVAPPLPKTTASRFGRIELSGNLPALSGTDDFDDNVRDLSKWRSTDRSYGGGVLTEIHQRLEFTVKTAVKETEALRPWTRNFASLNEDFEVTVDVHNDIRPPFVPPATSPKPNASIGIAIYNSADIQDSIYLELYRGSDGYYFLSAISQDGDETGSDATMNQAAPDGSLRLHYDSATKVITAYCDADGATGGYSWTLMGSFGINGSGGTTSNASWSLSNNPPLGVHVSAFDEKQAVISGEVFADNFQVQTN